MVETLQTELGFSRDSIEVLLDEAATSEAIVDRFERWLVDGTRPGDRVFFLYAGHGSQLKDQNGDEDDGFDETLAPFDVNPVTGSGQIRDDAIDALIAQLAGRRAVLLFDSCHSGTLTRSSAPGPHPDTGIRFLPRADQWPMQTRGQNSVYDIVATKGGEQSPFDSPSAPGRSDGIVAISAAGPGQLAFPVDIDGKPRGALTYLFQQAVTLAHWSAEADAGSNTSPPKDARNLWQDLGKEVLGAGAETAEKTLGAAIHGNLGSDLGKAAVDDLKAGVTVAVLETLIDKGMKRLQDSGRLEGDQEPFFEVLSERPLEEEPLFGQWQAAGAAAMANPLDDRRVTLRTDGERRIFVDGESMVLHVGTDRPGFLYLLVFSEEQKATCLFPNSLDREQRIPAGETTVPTHGGYHLPVREPFGRDVIVALVSDETLPLCERLDYRWDEIFARVRLDEIHARLRQDLRDEIRRGVTVEAKPASRPADNSQMVSPLPAWQTASLEIQTVRGGGS